MNRGKFSDDIIMNFLGLDKEQFDEIIDLIDSHPDWDDEDIAEELYDNM